MGSKKKSKQGKPKRPRKKRKKVPGEGKTFRFRTIFINGKQKRIREPIVDEALEAAYLDDPIAMTQGGDYENLHRWEQRQDFILTREDESESGLNNHSPEEEKIALFRDLFRGRDDLFSRRFESATTGRAGYAPACANEWVRGICEKPRIKCAECLHRKFLPVTDEVIRQHLMGRDDQGKPFVMGVYPMLENGRCWFLAVDFDGGNWQNDVGSFRRTCSVHGLPIAIERSRSGNGGHAWFFFSKPVHSADARQFGAALLTQTMNRHPELGFGSYDRMFPNQNTMPKGGFGNLIALPLQKEARVGGNSVFLEEDGKPERDQWNFLSRVARLSPGDVSEFVQTESRKKRTFIAPRYEEEEGEGNLFASEPWALPPSGEAPLPSLKKSEKKEIEFVIADGVYLRKDELSAELRAHLMRLAAFQNPEFFRAQAMRLSTWDKPRIIHSAEDTGEHLVLPRGCLGSIIELCERVGLEHRVVDHRNSGDSIEVSFLGELRPGQRQAGKALLKHDTGVLAATTAFGKTVLAAWLIAQRGVNTLILVHRQQLMVQWVERLTEFLDIEEKEIGRLGGGRKKLRGKIDVALIQSMVRKGVVDDRIADYGHLIIDECHHISARSFELAVSRAKARYVVGLFATVCRKDGHHPIIFMQCGPVRYQVSAKQQQARTRDQARISRTVVVRPTPAEAFALEESEDDARIAFQRYLEYLVHHHGRNQMICADVASSAKGGHFPLILTERTEHVQVLAEMLGQLDLTVFSLQGGMGKVALRETLEKIAASKPEDHAVLVATGKFVGEGFDEARLDRLFLAMPVSWKGTVAQYAGRLHRDFPGKKEVKIHDYADLEIPMLARMFDKRKAEYESLGYEVTIPAHALPGWPKEVPLPIDDHWKQHYAESAQSLIRDGVDIELAQLFAKATRSPQSIPEQATGEDRARSASEAFLFRRLETLPQTAGKFQLNAGLPIPFGRQHGMEVDFLWAAGKVVIEIDGQQHLNDPIAYRRDRHKDLLLQEHGYLVLRFLATDLGERYHLIVETILRVVAER